jgi:N-succinyldiaminopimelate aminotransferase
VAGDETVIAAFRRLRGFGGPTVPLPILAASAALWADDEHAEANRALYRSKFDAAERYLRERFAFHRPQGGFFLWLRVDDAEGAVRVLPGAYLSKPCAAGGTPGDGYIRIALVDDLPTTEEALRRICNIL